MHCHLPVTFRDWETEMMRNAFIDRSPDAKLLGERAENDLSRPPIPSAKTIMELLAVADGAAMITTAGVGLRSDTRARQAEAQAHGARPKPTVDGSGS